MLFDLGLWYHTRDCDPAAFAIFRRHYTFRCYRDGRRNDHRNPHRYSFVGPGEKVVLVTRDYDALWVWRRFKSDDGQRGVCCAAFRNESQHRASQLIPEAVEIAQLRWPSERLYTYIDPRRVRGGCPGYCFIRAGWRKCGTSQRGLLIFEKLNAAPEKS